MKKLLFGLIAIVAISFAGNAQRIKITVSNHATLDAHGDCVGGGGGCMTIGTGPVKPTNPTISIEMASGIAKLVFNEAYLSDNVQLLGSGYIEYAQDFALPKDISTALGISGLYSVKAGKYAYTKDGSGEYVIALAQTK